MTDVRAMLKEHIEATFERKAVFGVDDCTPWVDAWQAKFTGARFMAKPDWSSWEEAKAKIDAAGSLCALWEEALFGTSFTETYQPSFGDVGIVETRITGQVSGIFLDHGRFVWRVNIGVSFLMPRTIVKAWTFDR